jgi:hypothetical protein
MATSDFCSGSESASITGVRLMCCWRAIASSAVRKPFGALGRMNGSSFSAETHLGQRGELVAHASDQVAVTTERLLHLGKSGTVAVQDGDVDPRVGQPLLDPPSPPGSSG